MNTGNKIQLWVICGLLGFAGAALFQVAGNRDAHAAFAPWNGRAFYLTKGKFQGNAAISACGNAGYHMAGLWEIHEPSLLKYDT
jgi:hypothetical protein